MLFCSICLFSYFTLYCLLLQEAVNSDDQSSLKLHTCSHCNRSFKGLNYFRCHVKSHLGRFTIRVSIIVVSLCQMEEKKSASLYLRGTSRHNSHLEKGQIINNYLSLQVIKLLSAQCVKRSF